MIEDRIRNYIAHCGPTGACDDCIARALALRQRHQAQRVTRRLAAAGEYRRQPGMCPVCGERKLLCGR